MSVIKKIKGAVMTKNEFNWLTDEKYVPKEVVVHTNHIGMLPDEWDKALLRSYGYQDGDTIKYSILKGKTTLLGNPYMHEGI